MNCSYEMLLFRDRTFVFPHLYSAELDLLSKFQQTKE